MSDCIYAFYIILKPIYSQAVELSGATDRFIYTRTHLIYRLMLDNMASRRSLSLLQNYCQLTSVLAGTFIGCPGNRDIPTDPFYYTMMISVTKTLHRRVFYLQKGNTSLLDVRKTYWAYTLVMCECGGKKWDKMNAALQTVLSNAILSTEMF